MPYYIQFSSCILFFEPAFLFQKSCFIFISIFLYSKGMAEQLRGSLCNKQLTSEFDR